MQNIVKEISRIERESKQLGIPFFNICKVAKVNNSTAQRWRSGETRPLFHKWHAFLEAFEKLKKDAENA